MLPALADMIARAAHDAQVWIVTHSPELARLVEERCGVRPKTVARGEDGATRIEGMSVTGAFVDEDDE